jgi:hypothetical protein
VNANLTNLTNHGARHAVAPSSLGECVARKSVGNAGVWTVGEGTTGMQYRSLSGNTQSSGFFGTDHIGTGTSKTASGGSRNLVSRMNS